MTQNMLYQQAPVDFNLKMLKLFYLQILDALAVADKDSGKEEATKEEGVTKRKSVEKLSEPPAKKAKSKDKNAKKKA